MSPACVRVRRIARDSCGRILQLPNTIATRKFYCSSFRTRFLSFFSLSSSILYVIFFLEHEKKNHLKKEKEEKGKKGRVCFPPLDRKQQQSWAAVGANNPFRA